MRKGGDSYYVIVNKDGDAYTVDDIIEGEMVLDFDDEDEAEEELQYLIDEGDLIISVDGEGNNTRVRMFNEITGLEWDLMPDMTERPQALAYLKGERNDFND